MSNSVCNCPSDAEIDEILRMDKKDMKAFLKTVLLSEKTPKIVFKLSEKVAVRELTAAEKNAEFLAKVAEGDLHSWNAQRAACDALAPIQYTFQPVLKDVSYRHNDPW